MPPSLHTGTCTTCSDPCWWIDCPTGGWWIHDDKKTGYLARGIAEHDADPGWSPEEEMDINGWRVTMPEHRCAAIREIPFGDIVVRSRCFRPEDHESPHWSESGDWPVES